jgi:hypothetical protein
MKRYMGMVILAFSILLFSASNSPVYSWGNGEGSCYAKGDKLGSAGLSFYYFGLLAAFDYGLHDCISAGLGVGYNTRSRFQGDIRDHYFPVVARAAFHPFNLDALAEKVAIRNLVDIYVGLTAGWAFGFQSQAKGSNYYDSEESIQHLILREYVGMRYHFNDKWSLFIEDCAYLGFLSFGITKKF